jgi:metacaspase-1
MARRALLVGINDYVGDGNDLKGCVNDITNMRNILKDFMGFTNDDIRVLLDARATKQAIMDRLDWMVKTAKAGDYMVFQFSGHGSQVRDRNGDELKDQMDEILCPADLSWDGGYILDDDLGDMFQRIPEGCLLEVFLDCCHSGDGTRSFRNPYKSRYLKPPLDIALRCEGDEKKLPVNRFQSRDRSTIRHILWAGCRSDQTSADAQIGDSYNGAFTYYFCKHFRDTQGRVTRSNLIEKVCTSLNYNGYSQVPQLECEDSRLLNNYPLQITPSDQPERMLFLTTPYLRGEDVQKIQEALKRLGYSVTPDGAFGPRTRDAVIQFQKDKKLKPDGIVGVELRKLLFA